MKSERKTKHLSLSPKGYQRILRNTERFGWDCYKNVYRKYRSVEKGYKIEEDDDGFTISSDDKVHQSRTIELDFERYPSNIQNFTVVYVLECFYNLFYFVRKICGKLTPIAIILMFISVFNMQISNDANGVLELSVRLLLCSFGVFALYIISRIMENLLSKIAEGLLD